MTCLVAPPFITKQPTNQKIIALQDVTFAFDAKGFGVIYKWKQHKNNTIHHQHWKTIQSHYI